MRKRMIVISLSALAAVGLAGGAYAATQSSSSNPQQAFLKDAARRLHVSPARLGSALKQAFIDRINAAVAAGHLTPAQAKAIKQRIGQVPGFPLLPAPPLPGPPPPGPLGFQVKPGIARPIGGPPGLFGPPGLLSVAAKYLGVSDLQLAKDLRSGKSLAQIASAEGKSKTGLENALTAALKSQLDKAVSAGQLPRAFEQRILKTFKQHVPDLVNRNAFPGIHLGWEMTRPGPPPRGVDSGSIGGPPPGGRAGMPAPPLGSS